MTRPRFTLRWLMTVVFICAVFFSFRPPIYWFTMPHIYWYTIVVAGSVSGCFLKWAMGRDRVIGAIAGGCAGAWLVALLAYLGPVDPGGPLQYGIRNWFVLAVGLLTFYGFLTGLAVASVSLIFSALGGERTDAPPVPVAPDPPKPK